MINLLKKLQVFIIFNYLDQRIRIPDFEIENDSFGIELPPEAYELVDINAFKKRKIVDSDFKIVDINNVIKPNFSVTGFELNMEADTISMKSNTID